MCGEPRPPEVIRTGEATTLWLLTGGHAVGEGVMRIAALLDAAGCARGEVEDVTIVMAEVLNNVEEHAYCGQSGQTIRIEVVVANGTIRCLVEDSGRALPNGPLPGRRMPLADPAAPDSWPEGGFGWAIVRRMTTDLGYDRREGFNRLWFTMASRSR